MLLADGRGTQKSLAAGPALGLALIVLLAALVRFAALDASSLWNDELATVHNLEHGPLSPEFWSELRRDVHPPGYFVLLWLWTALLGDAETSLRALSALAGVAGCAALFGFARRRLGVAVAITSGLLAALSPLLVEYSQEARSYSLLCLITIWTAHTWLLLLEPLATARRPRLAPVHAGVAAAAAAYVHYSGLIAAGVIALLVAAAAVPAGRAALRSVALAGAVGLALYAPWLPALFEDLAKGGLTFLKPPKLSAALGYPLLIVPGPVWIAIAALAACAALLRLRRPPPAQPQAHAQLRFVGFLAAWALLTLALFFIKSKLSTPIFNARNLIVVAPPILVLAGWAAVAGARGWLAGQAASAALVVALCAHQLGWPPSIYRHRREEQFREATQCAIELAARAPDAPVVALTYDRYFDYYLRQLGSALAIQASVSKSKRLVGAAADAWAGGAQHVVLVWAHIPLRKPDRKRILEGRSILEERKLTRAGCMLLARE